MPKKLIAVYPGTFDPITSGHVDIIRRALKIVDKLIIAVAANSTKTPLFSLEERTQMVESEVEILTAQGLLESQNSEAKIVGFEGLLVNFAKENGASTIIRGLRAVSDFEYEFQMSGMNSKLDPEIETIFLPASESTHFVASSFVKQIAKLNGNIDGLVSQNVKNRLVEKFNTAG